MHSEDSPAGQTVYDELRAERARQDERWGGPEHDDKAHPLDVDWTFLLYEYITKAQMAAVYGPPARPDDRLQPAEGKRYRDRLVQVTALAVAAIESHDRKAGSAR